MRPFYERGDDGRVGPTSIDYQRHCENQTLYDELYERGDKIVNEALSKHMGSFMGNPPLPTFKELKLKYDNALVRQARATNLSSPFYLDLCNEQVESFYNQILNREYVSTKDLAAAEYRNAYNNRLDEFYDSEEYGKLVDDIYEYNEKRWAESKEVNQ